MITVKNTTKKGKEEAFKPVTLSFEVTISSKSDLRNLRNEIERFNSDGDCEIRNGDGDLMEDLSHFVGLFCNETEDSIQ